MPFEIIRQDITKICCDAIVNPTNTELLPTGGTDAAIHKAAGERLLEACRAIESIKLSEAVITDGFDLPSKFVIHTAAPHFDNSKISAELLYDCYKNCLNLAHSHNLKSIAVPLIGAGTQGFPKDMVLRVALSAISEFLLCSDMHITLVVFNKEAFVLSTKLFSDIEEYIDDNYAARYSERQRRHSRRASRIFPCAPAAAKSPTLKEASFRLEDSFSTCESSCPEENFSDIENFLTLDESFSLKLLKLIDAKGMSEVECYKKANVSKQTWYKIMNDKNYKPNKKTVLAFSVSLELTLEETQTLLSSVGFTLSESSLFDVIIMYCLRRGIYDIFQIDSVLFKYDQETLFSKY